MKGSSIGHRAIHTRKQPGAPHTTQQQAAGAEPRKGCRDPVCAPCVCVLAAAYSALRVHSRDLSSNVVHLVLCMLYPYVRPNVVRDLYLICRRFSRPSWCSWWASCTWPSTTEPRPSGTFNDGQRVLNLNRLAYIPFTATTTNQCREKPPGAADDPAYPPHEGHPLILLATLLAAIAGVRAFCVCMCLST